MRRNPVENQRREIRREAQRAALTPSDRQAATKQAADTKQAGTVAAGSGQVQGFWLLGITPLGQNRLG